MSYGTVIVDMKSCYLKRKCPIYKTEAGKLVLTHLAAA